MMSPDTTLDSLRQRIDQIDDQMHDLIMARCALVEQVGTTKAGDPLALRPGREAEILRRLIARHSGPFPKGALVRMWREMVGALTGLQTPLTIAVAQPERGSGFIELARNHFGVVGTVSVIPSAGQVVKMVAEDKAAIGIVPLPGRGPGGLEPWWVTLIAERDDIPRVVTRLPIYPFDSALGRPEPIEALVIAKRPHDNTGLDRTLVVIETGPTTSRDRVRALLTGVGFEPSETLGTHTVGGSLQHLVEVDGWVGPTDPRLAPLVREPVHHVSVVGGYPISLAP